MRDRSSGCGRGSAGSAASHDARGRRPWRTRKFRRGRDPREGVRRAVDAPPPRVPPAVPRPRHRGAPDHPGHLGHRSRAAGAREVHRRQRDRPRREWSDRHQRGIRASCSARHRLHRRPAAGLGPALRADDARELRRAAGDVRPSRAALRAPAEPLIDVLRP